MLYTLSGQLFYDNVTAKHVGLSTKQDLVYGVVMSNSLQRCLHLMVHVLNFVSWQKGQQDDNQRNNTVEGLCCIKILHHAIYFLTETDCI